MIEYFWTAGSLLVPSLLYISLGLDGGCSWQLFCILCAIPCVISSILGILVIPESPRWLTAEGVRNKRWIFYEKRQSPMDTEDPMALFPLDIVLTTEEEHSTMRDLVSPKWCITYIHCDCIWGAFFGHCQL